MRNYLSVLFFLSGTAFFLSCEKNNQEPISPKIEEISSEAVPGDNPDNNCGQFRTQTQGAWGAEPEGTNPGTYLHGNFAAAFPQGLTVGCSNRGFSVMYASAADVTEFLPAGGTAAILTDSYINPLSKSIKNVLVGHITALALSVGFDQYDPNFGPAAGNLGDLIIASGPFTGKTVNEFLLLANEVLGGCSAEFTPAQISETAALINQNYDSGTVDNAFLTCPSTRIIVPESPVQR